MSAFPNSPDVSGNSTLSASPAAVPPPEESKGRKWLIFALVALAAGAAWMAWPRHGRNPGVVAALRTAKAFRGSLRRTLRLSGNVTATRFANILAPRLQGPDIRSLVLIDMARSGHSVKQGERLVLVDSQAMRDHLDDVEASVDQNAMELRSQEVQRAATAEIAVQRVRAAKGALEQAQLAAVASAVKTEIDRELLRIAVEQAQAEYTNAQKLLPLLEERQRAEKRAADIGRMLQVRHRDRHRHDIERCTINSPINGVVVMQTIFRNGEQGQVRIGDQVAPGQAIMKVVDVHSLELAATMNQTESEMVHIGQSASVRFDAYPEIRMNGKVAAVGSMAVSSGRSNYYVHGLPVRISLEGDDARVLPDLTASADLLLAAQDDVVIVPREAVREERGKSTVCVMQPDGACAAREVELGVSNNTQVAVVSGLQAGEEIALQNQ